MPPQSSDSDIWDINSDSDGDQPSGPLQVLPARRSLEQSAARDSRTTHYISAGTHALVARSQEFRINMHHASPSIIKSRDRILRKITHVNYPSTSTNILATNLHAVPTDEQYRYIMAHISALRELYASRGEDPDAYNKKYLIDWPVSKKGDRAVRLLCSCRVEIANPAVESGMVRCWDPGCAVPGGWFHGECSGRRERENARVYEHFVCSACLLRRLFEDFPEFDSPSLKNDARERLISMVAAWGRGRATPEDGDKGDRLGKSWSDRVTKARI